MVSYNTPLEPCSCCNKGIEGAHIAWVLPTGTLRMHLKCARNMSAGIYNNVCKLRDATLHSTYTD